MGDVSSREVVTKAGTIVWNDEGLPGYVVVRDLHFGDEDWVTAFRGINNDVPEIGSYDIPDFFRRWLDKVWGV